MSVRHCHWIKNPHDFDAMAATWDQLCFKIKHPPFFQHAWFKACLKWQPEGMHLCIFVVKKGDVLEGIMPLRVVPRHERGFKIHQVEWLTIPETQFCGIISKPDNKAEIFKLFWASIHQNPFPWDKISLYPLGHEFKQYLSDIESPPWLFKQTSQHPWINLSKGWEAYYQSRSRRLKKGNNHLANRLRSEGNLEINCMNAENLKAAPHLFDEVVRLSSNSWKKGTETTLEAKDPLNCFKSLTQYAIDKGYLSLWFLKLNGKPIAFEYQLKHEDAIYALRSDYDTAYKALSPGSYLNWKILENLSLQCTSYYMGPGNNAYKLRWQNESIPLYTFIGYARHFKSTILYSINEIWVPKLKPIKQVLSKK